MTDFLYYFTQDTGLNDIIVDKLICSVSSRISRVDTHFPQKLPFDLYLTFILIHFNVYRRSQ